MRFAFDLSEGSGDLGVTQMTMTAPLSGSAGAMTARYVTIDGTGTNGVQAYLASPEGDGRRGGVIVIHHMPGFDRASKEIVRRFAELGFDAICPNLHWRDAPGAAPDDAAAVSRANGGVPDERLLDDVDAAIRHLRGLPTTNGKVGVVGYCSGGRQAVLAACWLDVDAAVDCYGAFVTSASPAGWPYEVADLRDQLADLRCPLLGLFGNDDQTPSPADVDDLAQVLDKHGKRHEFHRYDDAGHGFFAVDRAMYRVEAAQQGWARMAQFFSTELEA
jgi:carboxymethylenebutenolidase